MSDKVTHDMKEISQNQLTEEMLVLHPRGVKMEKVYIICEWH